MSVKYSVKFNDVELSNYIYVLEGFTPFVGANWSPEVVGLDGNINGSQFRYQKFIEKEFTMPFSMEADTEAELKTKYDALQLALNVSEPAQLIFESTPDRYCLAIPLGTLDFEQILDTGEGTIVWIVPDGLAHAITPKTFTAEVNDEGILEATIINNGSVEVPISYEITHNHDNGYIGIVSEYGAIQLGKNDQVDGEDYLMNENIPNVFENLKAAEDDHGTNYMHPDHDMSGALLAAVIDNDDPAFLALMNMGDNTPGKWCGGMRTITLPADSEGVVGAKNFWCYLNFVFEMTQNGGQTGEFSIAFLTEDNKVICGYSLYNASANLNFAALEFWLNGKIVTTKYFYPTSRDADNPFNEPRGNQDIRKEGEKVTYYWFGGYESYSDPAVKEMVCKKIQVAYSQYAGRNIANQYIGKNFLRQISFQKMNVEKWRDVPNRYSVGDVILIDGKSTKVSRNGLSIKEDEIIGSKYFLAPPGNTKVQIYCSDFSDPPPTVKAEIREAYL